MNEEFNISGEVMEQLRELNRRVGDIATTQAAQPTRADLQAYVLKEVFELEVKNLKATDQAQQTHLEELQKSVQSQLVRWLQTAGIIAALIAALITILHSFLPH